MKDLLDYIVKSIVKNPDDVEIIEEGGDPFPVFTIKVNPDDLGIVIGKGGSNIRAIRTLARLRGFKSGEKVRIELHEPDRPERNPEQTSNDLADHDIGIESETE